MNMISSLPLQFHAASGELVYQVPSRDGSYTVAWHPKQLVLAIASSEKDSDSRFEVMASYKCV